jgi:tetratricopeptide (TPR) repeat protein
MLFISVSGCAHSGAPATRPRPTTVASGAATKPADPADFTLEQILPRPTLAAPATSPAATTRPSLDAIETFARARDAMLQNQRYTAINLFEKTIALDPDSYEPRYWLGQAYGPGVSGSNDQAIAAFEAAAKIEPNHIDVQLELGRQYLAKKDNADAIKHLRLAMQTDEYQRGIESAAVVDFYLARALEDSGYDRAALERYESLIERLQAGGLSIGRSPELAFMLSQPDGIFAQAAALFQKRGKYHEALALYRAAAKRRPESFGYHAGIVDALLASGTAQEAAQAATQIVRQFHASPDSLALLRETYRRGGGGDSAAAQELERLRRESPDDRSILYALVDLLSSTGRSGDATALLSQESARSGYDPELVRRLFKLQDDANDVDAAAGTLISALAARPDLTRDLAPMWAQLLHPWRKNHLTVASLQNLKVAPQAEASRQFWLSQLAGVWNRQMLTRSSLEKAVKQVPPFPPAYRALIVQYWHRSDWDQAKKRSASTELVASLQKQHDAVLAAELRGIAAMNAQATSKAVEDFSRAMAAGGHSIDLRLEYAASLKASGDDAGSEQVLWKLAGDEPMCEDAYESLFQFYLQKSDPEQAVKVMRTWLEHDPLSINGRLLQASVLQQANEPKRAEEVLNDLFAREPDNSDVLSAMEDFYTRTNHLDAYVARLEAQRTEHPENRLAVEQLVILYAQQNRLPDAIRVLDAARAAAANDADLLYYLGGLYARIGQRDTTEQILRDVIRIDPTHPGANNDLGYTWADEGKNLPQAESMIRVAIATEPDNHSFLDSLGWVLYKRGQFQAARQALQSAVNAAVAPDPVVLDHLGDVLYRLNLTSEAAQQWRRSQERLSGEQSERDELKQLKLQLQQKLKQVDAGRPVTVAPVASAAN